LADTNTDLEILNHGSLLGTYTFLFVDVILSDNSGNLPK